MDVAQQQIENGSAASGSNKPVEKRNPVLIGDSVPGDSEPQFNKHYPNGLIDCYIGRWLYQAQNVYSEYVGQGVVGNVVILANFSNFEIQDGDLDEFYKLIKPEQDLFVVNVVIPDPFQDDTNAKLAAFADAPNTQASITSTAKSSIVFFSQIVRALNLFITIPPQQKSEPKPCISEKEFDV